MYNNFTSGTDGDQTWPQIHACTGNIKGMLSFFLVQPEGVCYASNIIQVFQYYYTILGII